MSEKIDNSETNRMICDSLELGDKVSFDHEGERLVGEVVRIYNAHDDFMWK
jgi:hypothetical protein